MSIDALTTLPVDAADLLDRSGGYTELLERLEAAPGVTIVIPIHNAPLDLERCLYSLRSHAQGCDVVLVDDRSTDERIAPLLAEFAAEWDDSTIVTSERNAGFVASINAGIRAADPTNDVVLLNSDTEVTRGWLRKLRVAAASRPAVATASPLSNAAGVFSVPEAHVDQPLPAGWSSDLCACALSEVSEREYEEVPVPSGFCLYIRREAFERVGLFDELLMRRGYGEENDFCARASAHGMTHVIDDATFVYHRRAASFADRKSLLKAHNGRVLKALHPNHVNELRAWEDRSGLDRVRRRYAATLAGVGAPPQADARRALEAVPTRLVAGDGSGHGERTATVRHHDGRIEVDVFGQHRIVGECPRARLQDAVAWLANRLSIEKLDNCELLDREEVSLLRFLLPRPPRERRATA